MWLRLSLSVLSLALLGSCVRRYGPDRLRRDVERERGESVGQTSVHGLTLFAAIAESSDPVTPVWIRIVNGSGVSVGVDPADFSLRDQRGFRYAVLISSPVSLSRTPASPAQRDPQQEALRDRDSAASPRSLPANEEPVDVDELEEDDHVEDVDRSREPARKSQEGRDFDTNGQQPENGDHGDVTRLLSADDRHAAYPGAVQARIQRASDVGQPDIWLAGAQLVYHSKPTTEADANETLWARGRRQARGRRYRSGRSAVGARAGRSRVGRSRLPYYRTRRGRYRGSRGPIYRRGFAPYPYFYPFGPGYLYPYGFANRYPYGYEIPYYAADARGRNIRAERLALPRGVVSRGGDVAGWIYFPPINRGRGKITVVWHAADDQARAITTLSIAFVPR